MLAIIRKELSQFFSSFLGLGIMTAFYVLMGIYLWWLDGNILDYGFAEMQVLKTVSLLREALWGVIQGIKSNIDFDYEGYTTEQLIAFEQSLEKLPSFKA